MVHRCRAASSATFPGQSWRGGPNFTKEEPLSGRRNAEPGMSAHLVERSEEDSFTAVASHVGDLLNEGQVGALLARRRPCVCTNERHAKEHETDDAVQAPATTAPLPPSPLCQSSDRGSRL